MAKPPDSTDLRRHDLGKQLEVGSLMVFKVWHLMSGACLIALLLGIVALLGIDWLVRTHWETKINLGSWTVASLVMGAAIFGITLAVTVFEWLNPQKAMRSWLVKLGVAVGGWLLANLHVCIVDRLFLRRGKLARLLNLPPD